MFGQHSNLAAVHAVELELRTEVLLFLTVLRLSAGLSFGSVKPKSAAAKT